MKKTFVAGALSALAFTATAAVALNPGATQAPHAVAASHSRVLPLEGGQNFRDLGDYRTENGRTSRWGVLYRSGAMNGLTPADFAYLGKLGIRSVCDFRSTEERAAAPVRWPGDASPKIFADDYKLEMGGMDFSKAASWGGAGMCRWRSTAPQARIGRASRRR